eukprot:CAMPEP_0117465734 /NCGR_PEP_ID=MMETSP0784-20121206/4779_1 /TAXON_ID=39447 /ORGANISM="" /LENGTH=649 /DNA_ID=CAMNT_0005259653 /DNA_START=90 /DNA_END=2036 /DNA_ORIENTATION=+
MVSVASEAANEINGALCLTPRRRTLDKVAWSLLQLKTRRGLANDAIAHEQPLQMELGNFAFDVQEGSLMDLGDLQHAISPQILAIGIFAALLFLTLFLMSRGASQLTAEDEVPCADAAREGAAKSRDDTCVARGRHRLGRGNSMPVMEAGATSLTLVARSGLTNFQLVQCMLAIIFLMHAADGAMLPGVFKALEEGLAGATPVSLGAIVLVEALAHSVAVLVWGVVADRGCKLALLMYTTLAWGLLTLATACVTGIAGLFIVRAVAGAVGAALGPVAQGLIGAVCPREERGRAFGFLIAAGQGGYVFGLMLAGSTSHLAAIGGWRGSFVIFSLLTLLLSWVLAMAREEVARGIFSSSSVWARLEEERSGLRGASASSLRDILWAMAKDFAFIMRRGSFLALILQGAFASTCVRAMHYQVMWYQYVGFSDVVASAISSASPFGCIAGALSSGYVADILAIRYPNHGRIAFGQVTDLLKLLVLMVIFVACDSPEANAPGTAVKMVALSFFFGFFSIMSYAAVVKPLFVEIVPARMVAQVVGLAAAIDGAFASFGGGPLVGLITERVFHYRKTKLKVGEMPEELRAANAVALGRAIAVVAISSTMMVVALFGLLHFTYPHDVDNREVTRLSVIAEGDVQDEGESNVEDENAT